MELNELLTWEALGSYVGLMAVTFVVVQVVKALYPDSSSLVLRVSALVTAVVASVGFHLVAEAATIPVLAMAVINGLLVALATMKVVEVAKDGLGATVISTRAINASNAQAAEDLENGQCPTCGQPLDI